MIIRLYSIVLYSNNLRCVPLYSEFINLFCYSPLSFPVVFLSETHQPSSREPITLLPFTHRKETTQCELWRCLNAVLDQT